MKIKVTELEGVALDFAVARCEKRGLGTFEGEMLDIRIGQGVRPLPYSTSWADGGPIIERENINLAGKNPVFDTWAAMTQWEGNEQEGSTPLDVLMGRKSKYYGPTLLVAAMRCYVSSKLGDETEVPDKLVEVAKKEEV
jgi:hypothetical protein